MTAGRRPFRRRLVALLPMICLFAVGLILSGAISDGVVTALWLAPILLISVFFISMNILGILFP